MKRIFVLLVVLFSVGFSEDLTKLGAEAYNQGDYQKAAQLWQKACDGGEALSCGGLGDLYAEVFYTNTVKAQDRIFLPQSNTMAKPAI